MKKHLLPIFIIIFCIVIAFAAQLTTTQSQDLKTYMHTTVPSLSFSYPATWGEPRVLDQQDKGSTKFQVDFGNYRFSVSNGYYFSNIDEKRPTVKQMLKNYEADKEAKNEVKSFNTEETHVANYPATKVTVENINGTHFTDVYIYHNNQDTSTFILIYADKGFVDDDTFSRILSTTKIAGFQ